jgi:preprotein translocase subunit SecD
MLHRFFIIFILFISLLKSAYADNIVTHNYSISIEAPVSLPAEEEKLMTIISVIERRMSEIGTITNLNIDKNQLNFIINTKLSSERLTYVLLKPGIFAVKDEGGNKTDLNVLYAYSAIGMDLYQELNIALSQDSAEIFEKITEKNLKKKLASILDNEILSEPVVMEKISGGNLKITFGYYKPAFNPEDVAVILRNGPLSSEIKIIKMEKLKKV